MTSTSVGMRCPECARQGRTKVRTMRSLHAEPTVMWVLIGLNVLAGIGSLSGADVGGRGTLTNAGDLSRASMAAGDWWTFITSGFLHRGLFHLFSNMLALWILGSLLEPVLGHLRFGLVYFVALFCGSFGVLVLGDGASAGASGAVFGLLGAAIIVTRHRGLNLMESGLGLWLGMNLLTDLHDPEHLGRCPHRRAVGGLLAALILLEGDRLRLPRYVPDIACAALGVAVFAVSIVQYG